MLTPERVARVQMCIRSVVFCAAVCLACGGDDAEEGSEVDGGLDSGGTSEEEGGSGGTSEEEGGSGGSQSDSDAATAVCGNRQVEDKEECDDGNEDEHDGCTSLCVFSCHDESDCDDIPCLAAAVCDVQDTHTCIPGEDTNTDGEPCGDNMACYQGECIEIVCNNGVLQEGEECDDGTEDDRDGCTTDCKFSCVTGDKDYPKCANDCDLDATCDDDTHQCVPGNPLGDGEICRNGDGYCMDGVCIASVCGDGVEEPTEECDKGEDNGAPDSGCTATCTLSVCGDGVIDGNEQCDDGNVTSLDGCNAKCKIELVSRATSFRPTRDDPPDFCVHEANTFGSIMGDTSLLGDISELTNSAVSSAPMVFLFHLLDVEDPTFTSPDPLIRIGASIADPDPNGVGRDGLDWENTTDRLDFPVLIFRQFYDDDLEPIAISHAQIAVEDGVSVLQTSKPLTMGFDLKGGTFDYQGTEIELPVGQFLMRDIMLRIEIDPVRSKVPPPPETADIEVPETSGNFDPTGENPATGILCGAIDTEMFGKIGIPQIDLGLLRLDPTVLCADQWGQIIACEPGQSPTRGECSSMLDFLKLGCSSPLGVLMEPLGPPDADTDGDGTNDSYTMVMRVATQRVKISGYSDEEPLGEPIPPEE